MIVAYMDFFECGVQMTYLSCHHDRTMHESQEIARLMAPNLHKDIVFLDLDHVDYNSTEWLEYYKLVQLNLPHEAKMLKHNIENGVEFDSFVYYSYSY